MSMDDAAEMAALRKNNRFQKHVETFGDRTAARRQKEELEQRRQQSKEVARENKRKERERNVERLDGGNAVLLSGEDAEMLNKVGSKLTEEAMMREFFGVSSFGKQTKKKSMEEVHNATKRAAQGGGAAEGKGAAEAGGIRGQKRPRQEEVAGARAGAESGGGGLSGEMSAGADLERSNPFKLPITHQVSLKGTDKPICALGLDVSGARLLAGGYDQKVKFYDFGGMNQTMRHFREIEPEEGYLIKDIQYNPSGSHFIVMSSSPRPKIFDRDGFPGQQFVRGDPYLHDKQFTKGHTTSVNGGMWHPNEATTVLTWAQDGTLRTWDINNMSTNMGGGVQNMAVIKLKPSMGRAGHVTAGCYSQDGKLIVGAGSDGSIQCWKSKPKGKKYIRPEKSTMKAHAKGTETSGLCVMPDGHTIASRGGDQTVKIWDLRKFKEPVKVWSGVRNDFAETNIVASPDGRLVCTGVSNKDGSGKGMLNFYDLQTMTLAQSVSICKASVVKVLWHKGINQIFAGCSDGVTRLLYSPRLSNKGALLCVGKAARKKDVSDFFEYHEIKTPYSLPMFKQVSAQDARKDHRKKMRERPEQPLDGPVSVQGRLQNSSMAQFLIKNIVDRQGSIKDKDPREELLRHAAAAAADPMFFGKAYEATQPKAIFSTEDVADSSYGEMSNRRTGQIGQNLSVKGGQTIDQVERDPAKKRKMGGKKEGPSIEEVAAKVPHIKVGREVGR